MGMRNHTHLGLLVIRQQWYACPLPALSHWEVKVGGERAAVDVYVGPERRSPRYHETYLALESIKESSAAVSKPRGVWLRVHIFKDLEKARRLPVRVEEQQAQQLAVNPPRSAGDGRQEIQLTAMVPIELPVLGNLQSQKWRQGGKRKDFQFLQMN